MAEAQEIQKQEKKGASCVINRLLDLKSGIEQDAQKNADFKDLEKILETIRWVLKNNPTQDEINSAKEYIQNLKFLNEKYNFQKTQSTEIASLNLWNLKEEYEIYSKIRNEIDTVKPAQTWLEQRRECISYNDSFAEINSPIILKIKDTISNTINVNFENLKPEEKENIKLWILWKMLNVQALWLITNKFSGKLENMSNLLAKKDFDSLSKTFDNTEDFWKDQADILKQILEKFTSEVVTLKAFVDKNKGNPALDNFLKSPKNISELNDKTDLTNFSQTTPLEERKFFKSVKDKLDSYDDKLKLAEETKEKVLNFASKSPEFISNWIIKFFSFLCSLPMIWDFIKKFLWVKWSNEKEIEEELKAQNIERKSLNNLRTYWISYNEKWELIEPKNDPAISIFKNKDLSKMSYKKMEKFFSFCKKNNLDINAKDFWYNVFEKKAVKTEVQDKTWNKIEKIVNFNFEINEQRDFYESTREPNWEFYTKLNKFVDSELKTAEVKEETSPIPQTPQDPKPKKRTSQTLVASGGATIASHNTSKPQPPEQAQETKELPENIVFDKDSQIATLDWKRYKVEVSRFIKLPIENVILDKSNWNLELDLWTLWTKKFDKEANIKLYAELLSKWKYSWKWEWLELWQSLDITTV